MSIGLAIKSFFKIIGNKDFSEKVSRIGATDSSVTEDSSKIIAPIAEPIVEKSLRSESLTLLSILQREARLIDFLKEDISGYTDEQVGSAVRDIHLKSGKVLEKIFQIEALSSEEEGGAIRVPKGFDQSVYSLAGSVQGEGPYDGQVEHSGWKVTKTELPLWSGNEAAANVIAPVEVEVK